MLSDFTQVESYQQILTFLLAVILGFLLRCFYDPVRSFQICHPGRKIINILLDVFGFAFAAVVTSLFCQVRCRGFIRLYVLIGMALGIAIQRFLLSPYMLTLYRKVDRTFGQTFRFVHNKIFHIIKIQSSRQNKICKTIIFRAKMMKKRPKNP